MSNKCKHCGYEYGEFDIFCSRCGAKINNEKMYENVEEIDNDDIEQYYNNDELDEIENENNIYSNQNQENEEDVPESILFKKSSIDKFENIFNVENKVSNKTSKTRKITNKLLEYQDKTFVSFTISLACISVFLIFGIYQIISIQNTQKAKNQFIAMMNNPATIPTLKEPLTLVEMLNNFQNNQIFLELYFKYSKDENEAKMKVFDSFLNQMEKLPHITSQSPALLEIKECSTVNSYESARRCSNSIKGKLRRIGVKTYFDANYVYLYPDYSFIEKTYGKYLNEDYKNYLKIRTKFKKPTVFDIALNISPMELAKKIATYEKFYEKTNVDFLKDKIEENIYNEFRQFIFNPTIYSTTTQEMKADFKRAYKYYIRKFPQYSLTPIIMSYLEKQKDFDENNFAKDYPYKTYEKDFNESAKEQTFNDIFATIRTNILDSYSKRNFEYRYSLQTLNWQVYDKTKPLNPSEFLVSAPDENNNITFYDSSFTPINELNIQSGSRFFLSGEKLYIYNANKLSISQINYNGRIFSINVLQPSDVGSIFPGINVVLIDSSQSYTIDITKINQSATYILLSRYTQGFENYQLSAVQGSAQILTLPNMFRINEDNEVILSFHNKRIAPTETSESTPTYKIIIQTEGFSSLQEDEIQTQERYNIQNNTSLEEEINTSLEKEEPHQANIMPKIQQKTKPKETILVPAPTQMLAPPSDEDDD